MVPRVAFPPTTSLTSQTTVFGVMGTYAPNCCVEPSSTVEFLGQISIAPETCARASPPVSTHTSRSTDATPQPNPRHRFPNRTTPAVGNRPTRWECLPSPGIRVAVAAPCFPGLPGLPGLPAVGIWSQWCTWEGTLMNDAVRKVKLPQGRCGDSLPINANASNTSLRQPEGRVEPPSARQGRPPRPERGKVR